MALPAPPLRIGVVGAGGVAALHLEALATRRDVDVIAIADPLASAAEALARRFEARPVRDVDDVLGHGVDLVHNCTPNVLHTAVNTAALNAGCHVVAEKPLATTVADAATLVDLADAAAENGIVTAVCFKRRHLPGMRTLRAALRGGGWGPVHLVHASYRQQVMLDPPSGNWRLDPSIAGPSGAMADIGTHLVDLVEFALDQRVAQVGAELGWFQGSQASKDGRQGLLEDHALVHARLTGGARAALTVSQVSAGYTDSIDIEVAARNGTLRWSSTDPGRCVGVSLDEAAVGSFETNEPVSGPNSFVHFLNAFYEQVRGQAGEDASLATFADGLHLVRVVDAILRSHQDRSWVDVAEPEG